MMKKKIVSGIILTLLLISMLTLAFNIQSAKASGTIYITSDYTFTDNIYEPIVVLSDNIVIDGNGYTLQGTGSGYGFNLTSITNVTIQNTNIKDFSYGIYLDSASHNVLSGNNITNNGNGIRVRASGNNIISGNNIKTNNWYGIYLDGSSGNNLSHNIVANNRFGMSLAYSGKNTLSGNNATSNRYNFEVEGFVFSHLNNYVDTSNTVDGKPIYYSIGAANAIYGAESNAGMIFLINCQNVTVKDLTLTKNGAGVFLWNTTNSKIENVTTTRSKYGIRLTWSSSNNTLTKNKCLDNSYGIILEWESNQNILSHNNATNNSRGIGIERSNNNNITSNTITDSSTGIRLWDASNNILLGNIVSLSRYGIELWSADSYGNILSGNIVSSSGVDGILLNGAHSNTLSGNIVSSNGQYGITIMADNNIIHGNTIVNNSGYYWSSGIYLQFHRNNIISSNTIKNNTRGISLYDADENNKIFHNNLINNTNQVYVSGELSNVWDDGYPSGGNYWSDYSVRYPLVKDEYQGENQDVLGSDGIWDSPYEIDVDNQDRYPLVEPWSPLPRTIDELKTEIEKCWLEGEIDNRGIVKSLIGKLNVAQKLVNKGKIDEAKSILEEDFIPQVQNLSEIHITVEAADILIQSAEHILSHL